MKRLALAFVLALAAVEASASPEDPAPPADEEAPKPAVPGISAPGKNDFAAALWQGTAFNVILSSESRGAAEADGHGHVEHLEGELIAGSRTTPTSCVTNAVASAAGVSTTRPRANGFNFYESSSSRRSAA